MKRTPLELLAPAGNAHIGIAAIDHGADAVYIGAPRFSARAQASNTVDEIAELVAHAHLFHARVYVALNTILTDAEVPRALDIIREVHAVGVDGLIIQDVGLLELDLPPIALIASTQMHNVSPEKVKFLEDVGFDRVILARELSISQIASIRARTGVALESFVHGALCVSYSGQCYMSQVAFGRSGNRGVCAQPCRHTYTLTDGNGRPIIKDKYLLSQKDMNRIGFLAELAAAGVTSFKIEGRYKEMDYIKNVTAAYRLALDNLIASQPRYRRAASGACAFDFEPDPEKTFNRGYTTYFLSGKKDKTAAMDTPKSMGQFVGKIEFMGRDFFRIRGADLHNGDGLCFLTSKGTMAGCRVERVDQGNAYPGTMADLAVGTALYRNFDTAFSRALKKSAACRTISVEMAFHQEKSGIRLSVRDEDGVTVEHRQEIPYEPARDQLRAHANIESQLTRTGGTPYRVAALSISPEQPGFLPLSVLNELRRQTLDKLSRARIAQHTRIEKAIAPNTVQYPESELDYRANVLNAYAEAFYLRHGAVIREKALEFVSEPSSSEISGKPVMTTRYCLRYELDACPKLATVSHQKELTPPLYICDRRRRYRLEFDCRACRMTVIPEEEAGN